MASKYTERALHDVRSSLFLLTGLLAASLTLVGCQQALRKSNGSCPSRCSEETLAKRCYQLWNAKEKEDWKTVFAFREPDQRQSENLDEFVQYCKEHEPFRVSDFKLGKTITDGSMGWAELFYDASMSKFPAMAPRKVSRWEKWRLTDGQWYPVPTKEIALYPESPALRDVSEERRLRERYDELWTARVEGNWSRCYTFCDPRDKTDISEQDLANQLRLLQMVSSEIHWIEVLGGKGTVHADVTHKVTDPNLSKLPPQTAVVDEQWVKVDGEWYLDLKE